MAEGGITPDADAPKPPAGENQGALKIFRAAQEQMRNEGKPTSDTSTDAEATKRILEDRRLAQEHLPEFQRSLKNIPPPDLTALKEAVSKVDASKFYGGDQQPLEGESAEEYVARRANKFGISEQNLPGFRDSAIKQYESYKAEPKP